MARYVDLETGETLEGTIARDGDKVIRKESFQYRTLDMPFVRLHELPTGLTKAEQKVLHYAISHEHLRGRDNAILTGNGYEVKNAYDLGAYSGITDKRQAQQVVEKLIGKGFLARYGGKYHLNWRIATVGKKTIAKDIYNLFQ